MIPESLAGSAVLGTLSGAIGSGVELTNYRGDLRGNLFILAIARSGTGKDLATNLTAFPLFDLERERYDLWRTETRPLLLGDLRRVEKRLRDAEKKTPHTPQAEADHRETLHALEKEKADLEKQLSTEPEVVTSNVTREMLGEILANQPGEAILSISSEARGIIDVVSGKYSSKGGDEDIYCIGFSGTYSKVSRRSTATYHLKRPCLSVLWMLQPDCFEGMMRDVKKVESGLLPRFLSFDTRARPELVPEHLPTLSDDLRESWRETIVTLVEHYRDRGDEPVFLPVERGASEILRQYDNEIRARRNETGDLYDVDPFAARWPEIAWRIALVLHVAGHNSRATCYPLSGHTARSAVALMDWYAGETLQLLASKRNQAKREREDRLLTILTESPDGTQSLRDLDRRNGFSSDEVHAIANRSPRIEVYNKNANGPGRPSQIARLVSQLK